MNAIKMYPISDADGRNMANGRRDASRTPLSEDEIAYVKSEIKRIQADEAVFVFNDENYIDKSTCYSIVDDRIYVTRNVFPDEKYGSTHPRDLMSVGAVLAHEYYGHRIYREEYLDDLERDDGQWTTPEWQDECRASITAAKLTPNLTERDKSNLVQDAIFRAKEFGHLIEMDDFMKEVVYGYSRTEKNITRSISPINYVREKGYVGIEAVPDYECKMSKMWRTTRDYDDLER